MSKRRKNPPYRPGFAPANAVAWCLYHDRGMNYKYIRKKRCLAHRDGKPCKHLQWLPTNSDLE